MNNHDASSLLSESTAQRIIDHILSSGLKEGDKLPKEKELCTSLAVGRSTLREALKILSARHIVDVRHGLGIFVSERPGISDDPLGFAFFEDKLSLLLDLLEFRLMIDPHLAELAALRGRADELQHLDRLHLNFKEQLAAGRPFYQEAGLIHAQIATLSGNCFIPKLVPVYAKSIELYCRATANSDIDFIQNRFNMAVDAIVRRDFVKARDNMTGMLLHQKGILGDNKAEYRARLQNQP